MIFFNVIFFIRGHEKYSWRSYNNLMTANVKANHMTDYCNVNQ